MALGKSQLKKLTEMLNEELVRLEAELKSVGRRNPSNPADWEARPDELDIIPADSNELADKIEDYETNSGIVKELEIRYNAVLRALKKLDADTYGICEVGNEPIEFARLEANPSARTCKKHIDAELPE